MHTTVIENLRWHHNGDFSGDVFCSNSDPIDGFEVQVEFGELVRAMQRAGDESEVLVDCKTWDGSGDARVRFPVAGIRDFVAERVRSEWIDMLEQADTTALMALGKPYILMWSKEGLPTKTDDRYSLDKACPVCEAPPGQGCKWEHAAY